jgi:hypothetical protein
MPTARPSTTTGSPEMSWARISPMASRRVCSGRSVTGSAIMPVIAFFTRATLGRLRLDGHVLVDDAEATFARERDGRVGLGHGVHRGRDEWDLEADVVVSDVASETSLGSTVEWRGHQENVVVGQGERDV